MKKHISNIVKITQDAMVSTILAPKAQVSVFGFDVDQSIQTHTSSKEAIAYVIYGCILFTVDEQLYEVKAKEYIELPANVAHALHAKEKSMMLLMIKEEI